MSWLLARLGFSSVQFWLTTALVAATAAGSAWASWEVRDGIAAKADNAAIVAAQTETKREVKIAIDAAKVGQQITYDYGMIFARAQAKQRQRTDDLLRKVSRYVPPSADAAAPINLGFVRLFDAGVIGATDPSALPIATGKPDDATSDVALSEIGTVSTANAGAARENADRIVVLQDYAAAMKKWADDVSDRLQNK